MSRLLLLGNFFILFALEFCNAVMSNRLLRRIFTFVIKFRECSMSKNILNTISM